MTTLRYEPVRVTASIAGSRVMRLSAMSEIRYTLILALVLGASVVLTTAAVAGVGPTPTATATPTPICLEPPAACQNNSDCCSNICSGQGKNKTCQPESPPALASTPTPGFEGEGGERSQGAATSGTPLNVNMSQAEGNQVEVAIAIDPTEPDRMFAFSNDERGGLFAVYSDDGGNEWIRVGENGLIPAKGGGYLPAPCCDPAASWDEFGTLFISYLTPSYDLVVAKSTDKGMTFEQIPTLSINGDRPVITTGPIINGESSVWVVYKDYNPNELYPVSVQRARVTPDGEVGTVTEHVIPNSILCNAPNIAVGPNGQVLVTCLIESGGYNTQIYKTLDEDGLGGQHDFPTPSFVINTKVFLEDYIPAQPDRGIFPEVGVVYDRGGSGYWEIPNRPAGRVYMVYTDESDVENDDTDIYVIFSDDDGETWSPDLPVDPVPPVLVNDDETNRSQFLPRIALDQTSGEIAVSWHDCRNDDGGAGPGNRKAGWNNDTQFFAATSVNGGISFRENVLVSEGTSDEDAANVTAGGYIDYGDYTGLAFHAGYFYPAWADNSDCAQAETFCDGVTGDGPDPDDATTFDLYTARLLPEPGQLIALSSGIMALWGLSILRVRDRGLGRKPE